MQPCVPDSPNLAAFRSTPYQERRQKKIVKFLSSLFGILLTLAIMYGCSSSSKPGYSEQVLNVGMLLAQGGLGDRSYNDTAYAGLQEAQKLYGIRFHSVDYTSDEANLEALRNFARDGCDLVIALGFENATYIQTVVSEFPDTNFAIIDNEVAGENVASVIYREQEADFLLGVLAASLTETKKWASLEVETRRSPAVSRADSCRELPSKTPKSRSCPLSQAAMATLSSV